MTDFIFPQGTLVGVPLLDFLGSIVGAATQDDIACHAPKPILLATGRVGNPNVFCVQLGAFI